LRKHIFAGANRVCTVTKDETGETRQAYFHSDHLGSSNVVTDSAGSQVGFTEFTPYGSISRQTGTYDPEHKFTGKELDQTGLYFYGARYYDAQLGRFTQADTIVPDPTSSQSLNRYSYCDNNPINYTDPTGHKKWYQYLGFNTNPVAKFASKISNVIDKGVRWLERATGSGWSIEASASVSYSWGPGGGAESAVYESTPFINPEVSSLILSPATVLMPYAVPDHFMLPEVELAQSYSLNIAEFFCEFDLKPVA